MTEMAEDEDVSTCKTINTGNGRRIGPMIVPVDSVRVLDAHEEVNPASQYVTARILMI
jgi:hypothetical protein